MQGWSGQAKFLMILLRSRLAISPSMWPANLWWCWWCVQYPRQSWKCAPFEFAQMQWHVHFLTTSTQPSEDSKIILLTFLLAVLAIGILDNSKVDFRQFQRRAASIKFQSRSIVSTRQFQLNTTCYTLHQLCGPFVGKQLHTTNDVHPQAHKDRFA